jgi:drug/metabolite transporter (DMT)-like permease
MAEAIYLLCALTSLVAAVLLWLQYQQRRPPLLLWSGIGFFGLAANNMLVFVDFALMTGTDLSLARAIVGTSAMLVLLYGLIWEAGR